MRLNPYLNFPGSARQAMEFYESVFGGTLTVMTLRRCRGRGHAGPAAGHARDAQDDERVHPHGLGPASRHRPPARERDRLSLSGDDADELRGYWAALSADGTVTVPLELQMWGDKFGACTDRFGVSWMVDIGVSEPPA